MRDDRPINVSELEPLARARMEPGAWDYYAGGAGDELTLADNRDAWNRLRLRPHVLVDVSTIDLGTSAFGATLGHPVIVAPTAAHHLAHPDGELATARGAAAAGALMTLSTISTRPMEEVAAAAPEAPRWFQLYDPTDRDASRALVQRAADAGYSAVALTVDLPLPGNRERDRRNDFASRPGRAPAARPGGRSGHGHRGAADHGLGRARLAALGLPDSAGRQGNPPRRRRVRAVEAGCDGVWVSNHGGRQLDTSITSPDALPEIVEAVHGRALIVVDGGVRRGIDVLKALALGADLVAVGRPVLWGLAVDGAAGVQRVMEILRDELALAMALAGCRRLDEITRDLVV